MKYRKILITGIALAIFIAGSFWIKNNPDGGGNLASSVNVGGEFCPANHAKSIENHGVTWFFQDCEQYGQFANGDYWIVGPATITKITPESVIDSVNRVRTTQKDASLNYIYIDWIKNGTMVNPKPSPDNWGQGQGFDNSITQYGWYSSTLNVAPKITGKALVVPANTSVVSSISVSTVPPSNGNYQDRMHTLAVLTVLPTPAVEGSFRPSISGTDKSIKWNKSHLNYNILRKLTPVDGTPALSTVESYFEKPWQTQWEGNQTQGVSPIGSMPNYGGAKSTGTNGQGDSVSDAILSLHLNYTDAQKEKLYIRLVQYGLDVYGTVREAESMNVYMRDVLRKYDGFYRGAGGLNTGRKAPVVFAGLALTNPLYPNPETEKIKEWSNGQLHKVFHEDKQTFYISQSDVTRTRRETATTSGGIGCMIARNTDGSCSRPLEPYTSSMVTNPPTAEWIVEPYDFSPEYAGSNWGATYRSINGATFVGNSLALMLTASGESTWNWPAYFDYSDRYWAVEYGNTGGVWDPTKETDSSHGIKKFHWNMWKAYRSLAGGYTPPPPPTNATLTTSVTGSGTITATITGTITPAGINCGVDCTEIYEITSSTSVTLRANTANGSVFERWSGACVGTDTTCTLTMTESKYVTATFTQPPSPPQILYSSSQLSSFNGKNFTEISVDDFKVTDGLTVSAWVKRSSDENAYLAIVSDEDYTEKKGYFLGDLSEELNSPICFRINGSQGEASKVCETSVVSNPSIFTHYVGVFDKGTLTLYKDGVALPSKTSTSFTSISTNTAVEKIGEGLVGEVKDVQVFNYALTPSQIPSILTNVRVCKPWS